MYYLLIFLLTTRSYHQHNLFLLVFSQLISCFNKKQFQLLVDPRFLLVLALFVLVINLYDVLLLLILIVLYDVLLLLVFIVSNII